MERSRTAASPPHSPYRLVLADDHTLFREGMVRVLEREGRFQVAGEAASGDDAVSLCRRLRPDLLAIDLIMPGMDGLDAIRKLREEMPELRIVALTMHRDPLYVMRARRAGAHGYCLKDCEPEDLNEALWRVAAGGVAFPGDDPETLRTSRRGGMRGRDKLTPRETEVLTLVAEGLSNRKVADQLGISPRTVEAHRRVITQKLGVKRLASLVRYAIRRGLVRV